jgi:hypothetical protein
MPLVPADWMQYRMPIVKYILWQAVQQVCAWHKYTYTHTHTHTRIRCLHHDSVLVLVVTIPPSNSVM